MQKEGRSKQGQKNNKAKQHNTPKAVTFPKKNELARQTCTCTCTHVQTIGLLVGNLAFITHKVMPFSRTVLGTNIYMHM